MDPLLVVGGGGGDGKVISLVTIPRSHWFLQNKRGNGSAQFNAKQGLVDGYEVKITTEPEETIDDGINSTHTDIELGEDEYKGLTVVNLFRNLI